MDKSKKSTCLQDLRNRILSQQIPPGSDLDEASLSETYGISRTPLREILHRLAGDGFVRLETNRGAKVASMDLATLRVFFQTAPMIYSSVARQAAENRKSVQISALKETQRAFAAAAQDRDIEQTALMNHQFHDQIGAMSHNPYLIACLKRMLVDHTRLSQTFFDARSSADDLRVKKAIEQHDAMICAIGAQEPSLAIELTLQHWDLSRDQMEKYVRPDPLPIDVIALKGHRNAL